MPSHNPSLQRQARSQAIIDATGLDPLNPIHDIRLRSMAVLATKPARTIPLRLHLWQQPIAQRYRSRGPQRRRVLGVPHD